MKIQAKPNETVNGLLYRVFGLDSDELEEQFYRLNPSQTTPFLTPGAFVEVPNLAAPSTEAPTSQEITLWT